MKKLVKFCTVLLLLLLLFSGCSQPQKAKDALKDLSGQMVKSGYTDFTDFLVRKTNVDLDNDIEVMSYTYTINDQCEYVIWVGKNDSVSLMSVDFYAAIDGEQKEEVEYLIDCIVNMYDPDYHDVIFRNLGDYTTVTRDDKRKYTAENRTYSYTYLDGKIMFLVI